MVFDGYRPGDGFGKSFSVDNDHNRISIGAPDVIEGVVKTYNLNSLNNSEWLHAGERIDFQDHLRATTQTYCDTGDCKFGRDMVMNKAGTLLWVADKQEVNLLGV
jgi:hypothetical protein